MRAKSGFTFLEVIIVLAVIGVILLVAIPKYNAFTARENLRSAAGIVESALQRAQAEAQKTGTSGQIAYDKRWGNQLAVISYDGRLLFSSPIPGGITFAMDAPVIQDFPCPGSVLIQVPGTTGASQGIALNPAGGSPVFCSIGGNSHQAAGGNPTGCRTCCKYCVPGGSLFASHPLTVSVQNSRGDHIVMSMDTSTGAISMGELTTGTAGGSAGGTSTTGGTY